MGTPKPKEVQGLKQSHTASRRQGWASCGHCRSSRDPQHAGQAGGLQGQTAATKCEQGSSRHRERRSLQPRQHLRLVHAAGAHPSLRYVRDLGAVWAELPITLQKNSKSGLWCQRS